MSRDKGKLLLVGSVYREEEDWSVKEIFENCASQLGSHVSMLPDGDPGDRSFWIVYLAYRTYYKHPDIVTLSKPGEDDDEYMGGKSSWWKSKAYGNPWRFTVREGVAKIRFDKLGYADAARESYKTFKGLRDAGVIAKNTRFLVCLPLTESGVRWFFSTPRDYSIVAPAYEEAMRREIKQLFEEIPHKDLAIQWDICLEMATAEGHEDFGDAPGKKWKAPGDPRARYTASLRAMTPGIPKDVWLGLHFCYGSLGHKHFCKIQDLAVSVEMANDGIKAAGRPVDFIHLTVPRDRTDPAYYKPLKNLKAKGARVYLGLIHYTDGVKGTHKRIKAARKYLKDFGIATECGFARRPPYQSVPHLLRIHREVAEAMTA